MTLVLKFEGLRDERNWKLKLEEQKGFEWMKNLHGALHGNKWILFHDIPNFTLDPSNEVGLMQNRGFHV